MLHSHVDDRNVQTGKPLKYQVIAESAVRQCVETIERQFIICSRIGSVHL